MPHGTGFGTISILTHANANKSNRNKGRRKIRCSTTGHVLVMPVTYYTWPKIRYVALTWI
jgi:hypothetical protein